MLQQLSISHASDLHNRRFSCSPARLPEKLPSFVSTLLFLFLFFLFRPPAEPRLRLPASPAPLRGFPAGLSAPGLPGTLLSGVLGSSLEKSDLIHGWEGGERFQGATEAVPGLQTEQTKGFRLVFFVFNVNGNS